MRKHSSWRGLYLIGVFAVGLLFADALAPLSTQLHNIVTVGTVLLVVGLTWHWTETHADLIETEGIDAQAADAQTADAQTADDPLQRRWFIAEGERYALPRPAPQQRLPAGNTLNTKERKYAILDRKKLH